MAIRHRLGQKTKQKKTQQTKTKGRKPKKTKVDQTKLFAAGNIGDKAKSIKLAKQLSNSTIKIKHHSKSEK